MVDWGKVLQATITVGIPATLWYLLYEGGKVKEKTIRWDVFLAQGLLISITTLAVTRYVTSVRQAMLERTAVQGLRFY